MVVGYFNLQRGEDGERGLHPQPDLLDQGNFGNAKSGSRSQERGRKTLVGQGSWLTSLGHLGYLALVYIVAVCVGVPSVVQGEYLKYTSQRRGRPDPDQITGRDRRREQASGVSLFSSLTWRDEASPCRSRE